MSKDLVDKNVRQRAIQNHSTSMNVEAGAGTGKTTLLTQRYISLLQTENVTPLEIVAITFTEKAAYELKTRIRSALEKLKMESPLSVLERAPISTIHSFAASILRERPIEAGLDPNFEVLDELGQKIFMEEVYRTWFGIALENKAPIFSKAIACGISMNRFFELGRELYENRDLLVNLNMENHSPDILPFVQKISTEVQKLWEIAQRSCNSDNDAGFIALKRLKETLSTLTSTTLDQMERALLLRISVSAAGNQKNWSPPDSLKTVKASLASLSGELSEIKQKLRKFIFLNLIKTLQEFVLFVESEKKRRGVVDFDDLLLRARDLLRNDSQILSSFQNRYRYLLIDEFQDTDPLQMDLLWMLASKDGDLQPGKLFLVGDPKQSIYRFRRADVDTYRKATQTVQEKGERLVIRQNFRSSPPLIDWLNRAFARLMGDEYEPFHAEEEHSFQMDQKPIWLLEASDWSGEERARDVRLYEAEATASLISNELIGKVKIWDGNLKTLRPAQSKDIAILFPTTTGIDLYEEQLRRYDIPFTLEGGKIFYQRSEIHGLLSILDAIEHPTDSIAVVAALKSPFFGCSDADLLELYQQAESFDYRKIDLPRLSPLLSNCFLILKELHEARADQLPSQILKMFLEKAWVEPLTLTRTHGEQAIANIERFSQMILNLEGRGFLTLSKMIRWFRTRSVEAEKQDESQVTDENSDRVHLMTIHKAKGLEFPIVILCNLGGSNVHHLPIVADRLHGKLALGIGNKDARFATDGFEELKELEEEKLFEEKKRLLYVACTRTKDLLILSKFLKNNKPSDLWTLLNSGLEENYSNVWTLEASSLKYKIGFSSAKIEKEVKKVSLLYPKRKENWVQGLSIQTPSQMAHLQKGGTETFSLDKTKSAKIGTAVHEIFEILLEHPTLLASTVCESVCEAHNLIDFKEEIEKMVSDFQESNLMKRILKSKRRETEIPFSRKEGEGLIEGTIDLAFEEEDGWVIVDYKTDRVKKEELQKRTENYKPQIKLYVDAVQTLTKKPVNESLLYFARLAETVGIK